MASGKKVALLSGATVAAGIACLAIFSATAQPALARGAAPTDVTGQGWLALVVSGLMAAGFGTETVKAAFAWVVTKIPATWSFGAQAKDALQFGQLATYAALFSKADAAQRPGIRSTAKLEADALFESWFPQ